MKNYPEHEKLEKVKEKSQAIGEFVDWCNNEKEIVLARWGVNDLYADSTPINKLLAEFFGIDLIKLEIEKQEMLAEFRESNEKRNYRFGIEKDYKPEDVVVWRGHNPCIGRIKKKSPHAMDCFYMSEKRNSMHYSNLRYATADEIKRLGNQDELAVDYWDAVPAGTNKNN